MSPSRLAGMVLVVYVLLPIRADLFATPTAPIDPAAQPWLTVAGSAKLAVAPMVPTPLVREEAIIPDEERERFARHDAIKCLYFDWFYDTGGMWVSTDGTTEARDVRALDGFVPRGV